MDLVSGADSGIRNAKHRTVGRNTLSNYKEMRLPTLPYPIPSRSPPVSPILSPRHRARQRRRLSYSPPKRKGSVSPTHSDRFIPYPSSPIISLREILTSPEPYQSRDGCQSPTNPQLQSPGKPIEWPNSFPDHIHSHRLASALELPISPKLLHFHSQPPSPLRRPISPSDDIFSLPLILDPPSLLRASKRQRLVPPDPFRILDAPELRDDYYAQPLSWSPDGEIAVALGMDVYLWSVEKGVRPIPLEVVNDVTSISFSPTGEILAVARDDGSIHLISPHESSPRVYIGPISTDAVGALSWRPTSPIQRASEDELQEWLVIGAFDGQVVLLEIKWSLNEFKASVVKVAGWKGMHNDQICGIAWSKDGLAFATGANDNRLYTYETPVGTGTAGPQEHWEKKFEWMHDAAVKALAFKAGKGSVLAAGGGIHDKKICFYNTFHGTRVSSLDVDAQITTLLWSPSTTEILATFGYTAPGISTKCAVYAYPSLQCLFAFEIADEIRALYAVPSPNGRQICLAGSDETVRFYTIWGDEKEEGNTEREEVEDFEMFFAGEWRRAGRRVGLSVIR